MVPTKCPTCGKFLRVNRREAFCLFHCLYRLTNSEVHQLVIRQAKEQGTWKKTTGRPRKKLNVFGEEIELDALVRDPRCKVKRNTLVSRLNRGWSVLEAVTTDRLEPGTYLGK